MKILYLSSSSDWHIDLWTQYFAKRHSVYLFSDKENYLKDQPFAGVQVNKVAGILGGVFNSFGVKSHRLFQINKFLSARYFAFKVDASIKSEKIDVVHAHSLYYG